MNMTIRPATTAERNYTYTQSEEILQHSGCIGHLRADMGSNGKCFYSSWDDHNPALKTQTFKDELDNVINALRFDAAYGGILKNRDALSKYCYSHPEASFENDREWGVRADTERYVYFLRLNPHRGEYNLYCYCYERGMLDRHICESERGAS